LADHKDIENARNNGQEEEFKARRRLLKASAAIPLIGTLSPGAALAATSTQCDVNIGSNFEPVVAADDKALRVLAQYWEAKHSNLANDLYEVNQKYYDALTGNEVFPESKSGGNGLHGYKHIGQRYVLCYVDVEKDPATGKIISEQPQITGFFPQRNTFGTAMSDSCWDSIGGGLQSIVYDQANG
jgi:hypothetical protein